MNDKTTKLMIRIKCLQILLSDLLIVGLTPNPNPLLCSHFTSVDHNTLDVSSHPPTTLLTCSLYFLLLPLLPALEYLL